MPALGPGLLTAATAALLAVAEPDLSRFGHRHRREQQQQQQQQLRQSVPSACPFQLSSCDWLPLPDAPQTVYQRGVPHTTAHGRRLTAFDPSQSFLPLVLYHALTGTPAPVNCAHPVRDCNYSLTLVAAGNFTAVHLWEGVHADKGLADAEHHGIQVIYHIQATAETLPLGQKFPYSDTPVIAAVTNLSKSPALLGWMLGRTLGCVLRVRHRHHEDAERVRSIPGAEGRHWKGACSEHIILR